MSVAWVFGTLCISAEYLLELCQYEWFIKKRSFPAQGVVLPQKKMQKNINLQLHTLCKNDIQKSVKNKEFLLPPPF